MTNVLIVLAMPQPIRMQYADRIREAFPELTLDAVGRHTEVDPYIADTEVLITFGQHMANHVFEKAQRLKWVQALGTGVDGIIDQPGLRKDVLLTNVHGFHGGPVSEAALLGMLSLSRELPRSLRCQAQHRWERFPAKLLKGKTVGILGIGAIAEELAPKCKALGMNVVGITSGKRPIAAFDAVYGRDELARAVSEVDYLVVLTPLTPATRNIVDGAIFAAMKPTCFLVNLARGGVVDETALVTALRERTIAGAALDVFAKEPLPEDSPLWDLENVIITTHQGGFCDTYVDLAMPILEHNMRCFLAGDLKGMMNVARAAA
jgi:D-2-hydroxyacid dehydrogenase (NADP+)